MKQLFWDAYGAMFIGVGWYNNDSVDRFNGRTRILLNELCDSIVICCISFLFGLKREHKTSQTIDHMPKHLWDFVKTPSYSNSRNFVIFYQIFCQILRFRTCKNVDLMKNKTEVEAFLFFFVEMFVNDTIYWCNLLIKSKFYSFSPFNVQPRMKSSTGKTDAEI